MVGLLIGSLLIGSSVRRHNFLLWREVKLPCSYGSRIVLKECVPESALPLSVVEVSVGKVVSTRSRLNTLLLLISFSLSLFSKYVSRRLASWQSFHTDELTTVDKWKDKLISRGRFAPEKQKKEPTYWIAEVTLLGQKLRGHNL